MRKRRPSRSTFRWIWKDRRHATGSRFIQAISAITDEAVAAEAAGAVGQLRQRRACWSAFPKDVGLCAWRGEMMVTFSVVASAQNEGRARHTISSAHSRGLNGTAVRDVAYAGALGSRGIASRRCRDRQITAPTGGGERPWAFLRGNAHAGCRVEKIQGRAVGGRAPRDQRKPYVLTPVTLTFLQIYVCGNHWLRVRSSAPMRIRSASSARHGRSDGFHRVSGLQSEMARDDPSDFVRSSMLRRCRSALVWVRARSRPSRGRRCSPARNRRCIEETRAHRLDCRCAIPARSWTRAPATG